MSPFVAANNTASTNGRVERKVEQSKESNPVEFSDESPSEESSSSESSDSDEP